MAKLVLVRIKTELFLTKEYKRTNVLRYVMLYSTVSAKECQTLSLKVMVICMSVVRPSKPGKELFCMLNLQRIIHSVLGGMIS